MTPRAGLAAAVLLTACTTPGSSLPTEVEARTFLDEVVMLATSDNAEGLCALGGGSCERILSEAGPPPTEAPEVVGVREIPTTTSSGVITVGGIVLQLCGETADGPYYTEMLVFRQGDELRAIEPVYWSGFRIASDGTTSGPSDVGAECDAN